MKTYQRSLLIILTFFLSSCFELKGVRSKYPIKNVGEEMDLSVMTFNILSTQDLGALTQGYPTWWQRKGAVFRAIEGKDPDLVTIQECSLTQFEEFRDRFGHHYFIIHKLALTPDAFLMVRRSRFKILEKGFWALENPMHPFIRRVAVWAKIKHKFSGRELMFVGTHLDGRQIKRREISKIKDELQREEHVGAPLILAGDFNVTSETPEYPLLVGNGWKDSYIGNLNDEVKTFTLKRPARRIDHIFYYGTDIESTHWERVDNKGYAFSDHFPVYVEFHIKKASTP